MIRQKLSGFLLITLTLSGLFYNGSSQTLFPDSKNILVGNDITSLAASLTDFNNDNALDILVINGLELNYLYINNGSGQYNEILPNPIDNGSNFRDINAVWGDFDNDGFDDVYLMTSNNVNSLLHNDGNGAFSVVFNSGVNGPLSKTVDANWIDYDNDGDLDLFVIDEEVEGSSRRYMYINDRGNIFRRLTTGEIIESVGDITSAIWGDVDNDGDADVFMTAAQGFNNLIYRNNGDGTFTNYTGGFALSTDPATAACFADMNMDGFLDLLVANQQNFNNEYYINNGDGTFAVPNFAPPFTTDGGNSWAIATADVDNDRDLEVLVGNIGENDFFYENLGFGALRMDLTEPPTFNALNTQAVVFGDRDNDGDSDLFVANADTFNTIFVNNTSNVSTRNWLTVIPETRFSNRSGIGVKVRLKVTGPEFSQWITREIGTQHGGRSQGAYRAEFGLGGYTFADSLVVEWPASGIVKLFRSVPANQIIRVFDTSGNLFYNTRMLNFDTTAVGMPVDSAVGAFNKSSESTTLFVTRISGPDSIDFSILAGGAPTTIPAGTSHQFDLRFNPATPGLKNAILIIESTSFSSPDTIALSGLATIAGNSFQVFVDEDVQPGSDVDIGAIIPDGFNATTAELRYRQGGEQNYTTVALSNTGTGRFDGVIPGEDVSIRGLQFYASMTDGQRTLFFPAAAPAANPLQIRVPVDMLRPEVPFFSNRYQMISAPLQIFDSRPEAVLQDDYGEYLPDNWRLFHWEQIFGEYQEFPEMYAFLSQGVSFWLITRSNQMFDVEGALSTDISGPFSIPLEPGWNQIANPFGFPVNWTEILNSNSVQPPVRWNSLNNNYDFNQEVINPWDGYFVFNPQEIPVTLLVPPYDDYFEDVLLSKTSSSEAGAYDFELQLLVEGLNDDGENRWQDYQNYLGMRTGALPGYDLNDLAQPPSIVAGNELSILHDSQLMAASFVPPNEHGAVWDLLIEGVNRSHQATLTFEGLNNLPPGFQVWLLDKSLQNAIPIENHQAAVTIPGRNQQRQYRLIIGKSDFAEGQNEGIPLQPLSFQLRQNFPNPFNPETFIEYTLANRSRVKVEVFNLLGQKLGTLVNAVQNTGLHRIRWNGRDAEGVALASGVYLYRLSAGNFVATRKMILLR